MSDHWIILDIAGVWDWEAFSIVMIESTSISGIIKGH